eukprot:6210897-Pleurochrysis_carterae.AAC.1
MEWPARGPEERASKIGTVIVGVSTTCATCSIYGISGGQEALISFLMISDHIKQCTTGLPTVTAINKHTTPNGTSACVIPAQSLAARAILAPGGAEARRAEVEQRRRKPFGSRAVHHEIS